MGKVMKLTAETYQARPAGDLHPGWMILTRDAQQTNGDTVPTGTRVRPVGAGRSNVGDEDVVRVLLEARR